MLSMLLSIIFFSFLFKFLLVPLLLAIFICPARLSGRSFMENLQIFSRNLARQYQQRNYHQWFDQRGNQQQYQQHRQTHNNQQYRQTNHNQQNSQWNRPQSTSGNMSRSEALSILGLESNPSPTEVRAAYQKLVKIVHPDRGGSAYFTQKLNQAKELLLKS